MSNGKEARVLSKTPSSSPPLRPDEATTSSPTAPLSPTATLGHSSPELPSLPELPPLGGYPVSAPATTGASDTSYFTASWGSPYQNPPPRSIASNLAPSHEESSLASSDIDEDSPDARFGLSHLVPSRLPPISRLAPTRPSTPSPGSPPQSPTRFPYLASSAQSIKQFFTSPKRPSVDHRRTGSNSAWNLRSGWWNTDNSGNKELELVSSPPSGAVEGGERNIDPFQLDGTADTLARTDRLRVKGHKSRDSNLTLTQDDFWPTFNLQEALTRSKSMYASRYAQPSEPTVAEPPTPPPKDTPRKAESVEQEADVEEKDTKEEDVPASEVVAPPTVDRITPPAPLQRTESSSSGRIKRTVKYRGKNVHINIPTRTSGPTPLSKEEVKARLQEFENQGYDIRGFDNWGQDGTHNYDTRYQNREIHPDPADDIAARRSKSYKVFVPNKALWDEYMAFLREEKLRMLGVSLGGGESTESPLSISRQGSSLPFSPPVPTSSAGSNRHGHRASVFQFAPTPGGHMSRGSIASPVGAFGHMHRQSMFSPPTLPMQGMTPPVLQSLSPQLLQALSRGSPGPELQGRHSPLSPYGGQQNGQGFPFGQRNELLVQMQRQKEQQLAAQLQQQAAMQQMLSAAANARPPSTLQEVPEVEEDDEFGRPQLRSRQGEGPEIVNPKPSHRHNISVKLEQGINNSDYHLEQSIDKEMDEEESDAPKSAQTAQLPPRTTSLRANQPNGGVLTPSSSTAKQNLPATAEAKEDSENGENVAPSFSKSVGAEASNPWANDPTFFGKNKSRPTSISRPAHLSHTSSKSSISGLNVAAKEFNPSSFVPNGNPSASFNPGIFNASAFSFTPGKASATKQTERNARKSVSPSPQAFKTSITGLSPAAPSFNPQAASFNPGGFGGFGAGGKAAPGTPSKSTFSFTSAVQPTAPTFKPAEHALALANDSDVPSSAGPEQKSIFGKIDTSAEGKKAKKSKAIPIVAPDSVEPTTAEDSLAEDEYGRIMQSDDRMKRAKTVDSDGEKEPLFAPMPAAVTLRSNATAEDVVQVVDEEKEKVAIAAGEELSAGANTEIEDVPETESELPAQEKSFLTASDKEALSADLKASPASPMSPVTNEMGSSTNKESQSGSTSRVFSNSSTLSAAAAPFDFKPSFVIDDGLKNRMASHLHAASKESVKESPVIEQATPQSASSLSETANGEDADDAVSSDGMRNVDDGERRERLPSSVRYFDDDQDQPSFQEIDAVMQQLNEQGSDGGIEREDEEPSWPNSSSPQFDVSPLPSSPAPHIFQMPQLRSDAPSPSPRRRPMITKTLNVDSASVTQDPFSDGRAVPGYDSPVRRLGDEDGEVPISDWDDVVSSGQEGEFRSKAEFFGPHVSAVIKNAMDSHYLSLEKRFAEMMEQQQLLQGRRTSRRARSRMTADSDADDEDDDVLETDALSRGFSPKRDRRLEKMRMMIQEAFARQQRPKTPPTLDLSHFENLQKAVDDRSHFESLQTTLAELKGSMAEKSSVPAPAVPTLEEMRAMIEESVAQQNEALIKRREEAIKAEDEERFSEFADRLRDAATRIAAETEARSEAERREAETNRLLRLTEEELDRFKEIDEDRSAKLRALEQANEVARAADSGKDDAQQDLSRKMMDMAMENENLKETLEEYRLSSDKWRRDLEDANAEREKVHHAFGALKIQAEEALRIRDTMRTRIEKLQDDMNHAVGQIAAERVKWQKSDAEQRTRFEILAARAEAEARTRERFERELERLELQEREAYKLRAALDHEQKENTKLDGECNRLSNSLKEQHGIKIELMQTQKENQRLEEMVEQLKNEGIEHQKTADQYAREFREAREAGRLEVDRTRGLMQVDIDTANNQVNIVRADLEAEISRLRAEVDNAKLETDTLRAKHELDLEEAADKTRDAVREMQESKDMVFRELKDTFEERLEELRKQHRRDLDHTIENKNQSESFLRDAHAQVLQDLQDHHERTLDQTLNEKEFSEGQLNERLSLAGDKIEHLTDKVKHLEEKLEMAKSAAAAAAAQAARSVKSPVQTYAPAFPAPAQAARAVAVASAPQPRMPEKISPQALRESIAVLQEQLQERETKIEKLEQELSEVDKELPAKLKAKETEVGWLRELIGVRVDDLSDLVDVLGRDKFNREAVRNAAIRIRASIQMEQDAKERQINGTAAFPSLATIQNFASPKAAQLAAAIGNWRRGGGGIAPPSALGRSVESSGSNSSSRTQTPSKYAPTTAQNFLNGLMTPPASNLRKTPSPDPGFSSRLRPLGQHPASEPRPLGGARALEKRRMSRESEMSAGPSTPPFLKDAEYDDDAEESTTGYYDDEESTVDQGTPRAERLRGLEPLPFAAEAEAVGGAER